MASNSAAEALPLTHISGRWKAKSCREATRSTRKPLASSWGSCGGAEMAHRVKGRDACMQLIKLERMGLEVVRVLLRTLNSENAVQHATWEIQQTGRMRGKIPGAPAAR